MNEILKSFDFDFNIKPIPIFNALGVRDGHAKCMNNKFQLC